jgi:3-oxoacyl-[acyl-carrier protein] reductase
MARDPDPNASNSASVALVTGASRGIGAATAHRLAARGAHVVVNFREKQRRADDVVAQIRAAGGSATAVGADLTNTDQVRSMFATINEQVGALDVLVLNASGGMELDAEPGYAMRLNRDAQLLVLEEALVRMPHGGRIVFVTSHQAHFHGQQPEVPAYAAVAASKRAGEDAIRARIPHMTEHGVSLVVVSGDMIDGTITVTLLDRANPGLLEGRRLDVGELPTIGEFAEAVATATSLNVPNGHTIYVGGADYLARAGIPPSGA